MPKPPNPYIGEVEPRCENAWNQGCDAGYEAGRQDELTNQVGFKMIDATPDGGYALRILRVYRQDCEVRWADTTGGELVSNPMLVALNEMQEQRAAELDKAIALLARGERLRSKVINPYRRRGQTGISGGDVAERAWQEGCDAGIEADKALLEQVALLPEVLAHIEELCDAWECGVISEHDCKGGERSNRNADLVHKLHKALGVKRE